MVSMGNSSTSRPLLSDAQTLLNLCKLGTRSIISVIILRSKLCICKITDHYKSTLDFKSYRVQWAIILSGMPVQWTRVSHI